MSLILITLTVALTSCGGKDAKEDPSDSQKAESTSNTESESAQEPEVKDVKLYDWNSILELPDPIPSEDNPENRMAHNIYVNPDLSQTSGQYTGFLIDFRTDCTANCTYWALCNWRMDTSELESEYALKNTGGAYAGLQNTEDGKKAIMSFWEISYDDENGNEVKVLASRVYPKTEKTSTFGGEGEGTNYIPLFPWEKDHWYRMYLNCYDNEEGYTLVEQWVQDMETKEWTGLTKFKMSSDTWWDNKKGTVAFTSDENTLYGITCGYGPDSLELNSDVSGLFEIKLTEEPSLPN